MKIAVKRDQFVGAFLFAIGILYGLLASKLDFPMTPDYPGPKAVPFIGIFGLIVCGTGIFIQSTRNKKPQAVFMLRDGWIDVAKSFIALLAYIFGLKYLGYIICTPILLFVLSFFFGKTIKIKISSQIIFSILTTAAIYCFYIFGFGMKLPVGELFR